MADSRAGAEMNKMSTEHLVVMKVRKCSKTKTKLTCQRAVGANVKSAARAAAI